RPACGRGTRYTEPWSCTAGDASAHLAAAAILPGELLARADFTRQSREDRCLGRRQLGDQVLLEVRSVGYVRRCQSAEISMRLLVVQHQLQIPIERLQIGEH